MAMPIKGFLKDDEVAEIKNQHQQCHLKRYTDPLQARQLVAAQRNTLRTLDFQIVTPDVA
jgi:hypothetical protein